MPERRRRKLVDSFQYRLIKRMAVYWAVYQLTLWNFLFGWRLLQAGRGNLLQQYAEYCREFYPMLICFLILVPAFTWDAVKFYHRIAGPLVRFKRAARDIAEGRSLQRIVLRENDELMGLQDDFNDMLESLARCGAVTLIDDAQATGRNELDADRAVNSSDTGLEDLSHVAS